MCSVDGRDFVSSGKCHDACQHFVDGMRSAVCSGHVMECDGDGSFVLVVIVDCVGNGRGFD